MRKTVFYIIFLPLSRIMSNLLDSTLCFRNFFLYETLFSLEHIEQNRNLCPLVKPLIDDIPFTKFWQNYKIFAFYIICSFFFFFVPFRSFWE